MREQSARARETYDAFAGSYDCFNHRYQYERWSGKLLEVAGLAGLEGDRLLDVGCGTGLSCVLPLARGWSVCGCDISPAMIEIARERVGNETTLEEADMRSLPNLGEFDLIWAVNDAINYLADVEELEVTFAGMMRNLAPGGVVVFDVNTLATYRTFFAEELVVESGGRRMVWRGLAPSGQRTTGSTFEASFDGEGPGVRRHVHRQRHFGEEEVLEALGTAGLRCVGLWGEIDGELERGLDEARNTKAVYVCRAADS